MDNTEIEHRMMNIIEAEFEEELHTRQQELDVVNERMQQLDATVRLVQR